MAQNNTDNLFNTSGILIKKDACVVIVHTEWNAAIVNQLTDSAVEVLKQNGITNIRILKVPGAVEINFAVHSVLQQGFADAIITLGCVVKGDTPHFDYVCQSITQGITLANAKAIIPVIMGILTVNNEQQALDRIKNGIVGDKGAEAAIAAIKMISFQTEIKKTNLSS